MAETLDPSSADVRTLATKVTGSPCHFIHNTEAEPLSGGEYIVYALESSDDDRVSIRIPKNRTNPYTPLLLKREADIRQRIDDAGLRLFQPLLAFSTTTENPLCAPFLALGWAEGKPLCWSDTQPAAEDERRRVLRSIANASLDLISIHERSKLPLSRFGLFLIRRIEETALDWIESKIHRKITRAQAGSLPGGTVAECKRQMELTKSYWIPELDTAPHVLVHGDLSGNNIIVDGDHGTVQG